MHHVLTLPTQEYKAVRRPTELQGGPWGVQPNPTTDDDQHGYHVGSYGVGRTVGVARKAELVLMRVQFGSRQVTYREKLIEAVLLIADDAATKPKNTVVVNMSFGAPQPSDKGISKLYTILRTLQYLLPSLHKLTPSQKR
jgi:hypothetical protein